MLEDVTALLGLVELNKLLRSHVHHLLEDAYLCVVFFQKNGSLIMCVCLCVLKWVLNCVD
jgi:hypothetical protein